MQIERTPILNPRAHFECIHGRLDAYPDSSCMDVQSSGRDGIAFLWHKTQIQGAWKKIKPGTPIERLSGLLNDVQNQEDCFFSVNTFNNWRKTPLLKTLNACYVDLDWGRPVRSSDQRAIFDTIEAAGLPQPGLVIETGRGVHLYWLLEPTPARHLPIWQAIEDRLIEALLPMKADPAVRDCTRMLRLSGSLNGKNGAYVKGELRESRRWSIEALAQAVLGEVPRFELPAARQQKPQGDYASRIRAPHRWHGVLNDLVKIAREWRFIPAGHRDQWLFLCAVSLSWFASPDSIEDEVRALAQRHTRLSDIEIDKAIRCALERARKAERGEKGFWRGLACDPRYRFKRETLYRLMAPLIRSGIAGTLCAIISEETALARKKTRDSERWQGHYTKSGCRTEHQDRVDQAHQLRRAGRRLGDIATILGMSLSTIKRWLTLPTKTPDDMSEAAPALVLSLPASARALRIDTAMMAHIQALLAQRSANASCIPAPRAERVLRLAVEEGLSHATDFFLMARLRNSPDEAVNDARYRIRAGEFSAIWHPPDSLQVSDDPLSVLSGKGAG